MVQCRKMLQYLHCFREERPSLFLFAVALLKERINFFKKCVKLWKSDSLKNESYQGAPPCLLPCFVCHRRSVFINFMKTLIYMQSVYVNAIFLSNTTVVETNAMTDIKQRSRRVKEDRLFFMHLVLDWHNTDLRHLG